MRLHAAIVVMLVCAPPSAAAPSPSVVLITLDTTRADRMGFLGSDRGLTPELDALAREAVVFERAYSQAPVTTSSHATILTGLRSKVHGVTGFGEPLAPAVPYLPELLRAKSYRTGAFVGALVLDPIHGLAPGFERGFDTYDAGFGVRLAGQDRYKTLERRASDVVDHALAWLGRFGSDPYFLWVHLYDPHDPYEAPTPRVKGRAPYDAEIAYTDAAVGKLLAGVRAKQGWDRTVVAICADHGESLGDHGEDTHGVFLYEASLHVPLMVKRLAGRSAGRRVQTRVSLVDLAPSLLEETGMLVPEAMQGRSFWRSVEPGGAVEERPACADNEYPLRAFGWSALRSLRLDRFLLIDAPRRELYDLQADPGATKDLAGDRPQVAERLSGELPKLCGSAAGAVSSAASLSAEVAERLAALGYVGGGRAGPSAARGADPKDKIAVANALHAAIMAAEGGDTLKAIPLLERVVASDPDIPMAQLQLGVARARLLRYAQALPPLHKAVELQPDSVMAHYAIAAALFETGDINAAATHYEIVVRLRPRWADALFLLARTYDRLGRSADAVRVLREALAVDITHGRASVLLARLLKSATPAPSPH